MSTLRALLKDGSLSLTNEDGKIMLSNAAMFGHYRICSFLLNKGCPVNSRGTNALHAAAMNDNVRIIHLLFEHGLDVKAVDNDGLTPLHLASRTGKTKAAIELLGLGANKAVVAGRHGTPVHQASIGGHFDTVLALLGEGCSTDVLCSNGRSVLHFAAVGGNVDIIKCFSENGLDVNAVDNDEETPLHLASMAGKTHAAIELLGLGANKAVVAGRHGTPLHQASIGGHFDTVLALLGEVCSTDVLCSDGGSVLHFAAKGGNVDIIKYFSENGLDINAVDNDGLTPLHLASRTGKTKAAIELLGLGANKAVVAGRHGTPVHQASIGGHFDTVLALLDEGCSTDVLCSNERSLLHFAAKGGNVDIIKCLSENGLDINAVDNTGQTPLHRASWAGKTNAAIELLRLGANLEAYSADFGIPLHMACFSGKFEIVELLLEKGSPLDVLDNNGDSVLHYASAGGNIAIMEVILRHIMERLKCVPEDLIGGGLNISNSFGQTPLTYVVLYSSNKMAELLIDYGADVNVRDNVGTTIPEYALINPKFDLDQFRKKLDFSNNQTTAAVLSSSFMVSYSSICGNVKSFTKCINQVDLPLPKVCLSLAVNVHLWYYPSLLKWKQNSLSTAIPGKCPLNALQISLLSIFLDSNIVDYSYRDFIFQLLSHSKLHYMINEHLPNGLTALDLARQFKLPDIATAIEEKGGRAGIWANIPREDWITLTPCLPHFIEAHEGLMKLAKSSSMGKVALRHIHRLVFQKELGYPNEVEMEKQQLLREALNTKPSMMQIAKLVTPKVNKDTFESWMEIAYALGISDDSIDNILSSKLISKQSFIKLLNTWIKEGRQVTWSVLLDVLGNYETQNCISEIKESILKEYFACHPKSISMQVHKCVCTYKFYTNLAYDHMYMRTYVYVILTVTVLFGLVVQTGHCNR